MIWMDYSAFVRELLLLSYGGLFVVGIWCYRHVRLWGRRTGMGVAVAIAGAWATFYALALAGSSLDFLIWFSRVAHIPTNVGLWMMVWVILRTERNEAKVVESLRGP